MPVLSIQSRVIQGHVGNAAATLPLQLLGQEVWAVDTVTFSNHPGRGRFRGRVVPPGEVADLLLGLEEQNIFGRCQAVVSGYLGDAGNTTAIATAVRAVKAANPAAVYILDPVMGDSDVGDGGALYVRPGVPPAIRADLLPIADLMTPNQFEVEHLVGRSLTDTADAIATARTLGPPQIIITSLRALDTPNGQVDTLLVTADAAWRVRQTDLGRRFDGAGDLFTALFLGYWLAGGNAPAALGRACAALAVVLSRTAALEMQDMALTGTIAGALTAPACDVVPLTD